MRTIGWILCAMVFGASLALPDTFTYHLNRINEVYTNSDGTLQFVEIIATAGGQTELAPTRVTSFNADGTVETLVFDFTASFPSLGRNGTLLLATKAFESVAGFPPDFVIPDRSIPLNNGRVVFKTDFGQDIDGVAYGQFSGNNIGFGIPARPLPHDTINSLTRITFSGNNFADFAVSLNSPRSNDGRTTAIQGGFMLALLSDTDEIVRFDVATGRVVQRAPAGFDVKNSSGIDIGTAGGVNNGNPFVVVTQTDQETVRLYDGATLRQFARFTKGANDVGWDGVGFDGANWIFSVPDGLVGDPAFQGADLINMTASVSSGRVVKFDSINLNTPDGTFDVLGGMGIARLGVAVVTGRTGPRTGGGDRSLAQIMINNNRLTRGPIFTTQAGNDGEQPGVSGVLATAGAGNLLISVPGSANLRITDPRTGQRVGMLTINGLDFSLDVAPDNAVAGLSGETSIGGPR